MCASKRRSPRQADQTLQAHRSPDFCFLVVATPPVPKPRRRIFPGPRRRGHARALLEWLIEDGRSQGLRPAPSRLRRRHRPGRSPPPLPDPRLDHRGPPFRQLHRIGLFGLRAAVDAAEAVRIQQPVIYCAGLRIRLDSGRLKPILAALPNDWRSFAAPLRCPNGISRTAWKDSQRCSCRC